MNRGLFIAVTVVGERMQIGLPSSSFAYFFPSCFSLTRSFAVLYVALISVVLFDVVSNELFIPPRCCVGAAAASLERILW